MAGSFGVEITNVLHHAIGMLTADLFVKFSLHYQEECDDISSVYVFLRRENECNQSIFLMWLASSQFDRTPFV